MIEKKLHNEPPSHLLGASVIFLYIWHDSCHCQSWLITFNPLTASLQGGIILLSSCNIFTFKQVVFHMVPSHSLPYCIDIKMLMAIINSQQICMHSILLWFNFDQWEFAESYSGCTCKGDPSKQHSNWCHICIQLNARVTQFRVRVRLRVNLTLAHYQKNPFSSLCTQYLCHFYIHCYHL